MVDCFNSPIGNYFGPEWQHLVDIMARYLAVLNSSINFIIYCVADKKFRCILGIFFRFRTDIPECISKRYDSIFNLIQICQIKFETHFIEDLGQV